MGATGEHEDRGRGESNDDSSLFESTPIIGRNFIE